MKEHTREIMLATAIGPYTVFAMGDSLAVSLGRRWIARRHVAGFARFLSRVPAVKVSLGRTEDFDIVYVFDPQDGFGFAINVDQPDLSEWGYAPFPLARPERKEAVA